MILFRKAAQLRIRRTPGPEPPWWHATSISPYSGRRAHPVAIDYVTLEASSADRLEVTVCDDVRDALERATARQPLREPVLIDAAEAAEEVFRRGEEALRFCEENGIAALHLISTLSGAPAASPAQGRESTIAIAAWPLDFDRLESLAKEMKARSLHWGLAVPLLYPMTTDLGTLALLAQIAASNGAAFFAPVPLAVDPTAKQVLAADEEEYANLFHADLEPVMIATERHIAALASENRMRDFVVPPGWGERSNWNAAVLLTLTASRMIAMEEESELAGAIARSARIVADLDKPLVRIAEAASLSIVEALDEVSLDILGDWLESGSSAFVDRINERWRLRRDAGVR